MKFTFKGRYKSISDITWAEIPPLVIVTGVNGSGKTQLLELIEIAAKKQRPHATMKAADISGIAIEPDQVMRLTANWNKLEDLKAVGVQDVQKDTDSFQRQFESWRQDRQQGRFNRRPFHDVFELIVKKIGRRAVDIERNQVSQEIPTNLRMNRAEIFNSSFAKACVRYAIRDIQLRADGNTREEIEARYGPPPCDVLNAMLDDAGMPFRVNDLSKFNLEERFVCVLRDVTTGNVVKFPELSSGEQVIVSLVFWLFNFDSLAMFPRLLLLDEPDAHLHPSIAKQFVDVVHNVIVKRYGVQVIMTSHLPSTVAVAPEESLFEMYRKTPRIRKVTRQQAISSLTAGLVVVRPGARIVIVEDKSDVEFYEATVQQLRRMDRFSPDVPLLFISAGRNSSDQPTGGRQQVEKWVGRLRDEAGMSEIVGIVDRDDTTTDVPGVVRLKRYSYENYLYDPLVTYACLHAEDRAPAIDGIDMAFGDEREICRLSPEQLERIADAIISQVEARLDDLSEKEKERIEVAYVNGARCALPRWLGTRRGKDVRQAFQSTFGQQPVNPTKATQAFLRTRFIPEDLRDVFAKLQSL